MCLAFGAIWSNLRDARDAKNLYSCYKKLKWNFLLATVRNIIKIERFSLKKKNYTI